MFLSHGYPDVNDLVDTCREKHGIAIGGGGRRVRVVAHLGVGPDDGDALVTVAMGGKATFMLTTLLYIVNP